MVKKGSALLFTLIIITIIGAVALTLSRSTLAGVGFTSNISDSMSAEQASKAGLEYGILQYNNNPNIAISNEHHSINQYNEFILSIFDNNGVKTIESTGHTGAVYRKHQITRRGSLKTVETWETTATRIDQILTCPTPTTGDGYYVATSEGHNGNLLPYLKCTKLDNATIDYNDFDEWSGSYDQHKARSDKSGNYAVIAIGHRNTNAGKYIKWAKIITNDSFIDFQNSINQTAPNRSTYIDCSANNVIIGGGHNSQRYERVYCAPLETFY